MKITQVQLFVGWLLILGLNQALIRFALFRRVPALFWAIQAMNVIAIAVLVVKGVPGLVGTAKLINWIVALVIGMHFAQNFQARMISLANERREELEREWEELEARRAEIHRQEAEEKARVEAAKKASPPPDAPPPSGAG